MKRLAAVFTLIFVLSLPVFAGHNQVGGTYCDCHTAGCLEDYPGECGGGGPYLVTQQDKSPSDPTAELGILLVALLLWLRLKA
jgi:hypothetical protein